ncbi:probable small intestine urate exporter [Echinops telfairi]|uniref:Probable small intestine urate exporter n=1 Tax=Echinops telfairi TaxID=9371 RepID=A0ABM0J167_ECHTE|nr:probable small intestine urate exporter [Echinops telfairi]
MSTAADTNITEGDISNDGNLHMAQSQHSRKAFCSVRHSLAFTLQLCNFAIFTQQMNMSIAMPAMVSGVALTNHSNTSTERPLTGAQAYGNGTLEKVMAVAPVYDWSPEIQGIILSSLNYGSFFAPIPTGYLVGIFGAKRIVGAGLFTSSVLSLFIPLVAGTGVTWLILIRIVQGLAQVVVSTGQFSLWVKWAPPTEKAQLTSIATSGIMLGCFVVFAAGGHICQTVGWPYIFYIFGGIGCMCSVLWCSLVYDDPRYHPFISKHEKEYIMCALKKQDCSSGWSLPIRAMIQSLPLWAILISYFCSSWPFSILMAYTPTYINSVLEVNLTHSGVLSALPFVTGCICVILGGFLADFLLSRTIFSLVTIRKLLTAIGVLTSSLLMVSLYWVRANTSVSVAFLILYPAFGSLSDSGVFVNILDIAPRYAAFLKGLSEIFVLTAGALSPTTTGYFIGQDSELGWRNIFLLSAAINIFGLALYLNFGQADVQDWAKEQPIASAGERLLMH